ncbi:MAG TPA: Dot/Icm secretion system protein IcmQ [Coxiellaceae bacterium]|nr:Dot/Icm secretion system protein IcmQ [Coxiellaceae bacterium]
MSFDKASRDREADLKNKETLLTVLQREEEVLDQLSHEFYNSPRKDNELSQKVSTGILTIINRILEAGDWDTSLFLRNTIKPIRKLKEEILAATAATGSDQAAKNPLEQLRESQQAVYISLYLAGGHDLKSWERLLKNLPRYVQGRPVYEKEESVQRLIRSKADPSADSYVVVAIRKQDILAPSSYTGTVVDRLDQPLLTLKEGAIQAEGIVEFVHLGQRYRFDRGRLIE